MTKVLLRDPLFLGSVVAVALTTGTLLWRHVDFSFLHATTKPDAETPNTVDSPKKAMVRTWLATGSPPVASQSPTQAVPAPSGKSTYSATEKKFEIRKSRPKNGTTWVLGKEAGDDIDATELQLIIANAEEGDRILIRPGEYEGNFSGAPNNVEVTGDDGVTIKLGRSPFGDIKTLSLKNLTLRTTDAYGYSLYGWTSVLNLDKIALVGDGRSTSFSVMDGASLRMRDSSVKHLYISAGQGTVTEFEGTSFSQSDSFFRYKGGSSAVFRKCIFDNFSSHAFSVGIGKEIKIEDSKFMNGEAGFYSSENETPAQIAATRVSFSQMEYVKHKNAKMFCEDCKHAEVPWSSEDKYLRRR